MSSARGRAPSGWRKGGRREGRKETFEPSGPGLGRALGGDKERVEGGGLWAGPSRIRVEGYLLDGGSLGVLTEFVMLKRGPPLSEALQSRSLRGEEDPPAASDWRKRTVGFFPLGSSLGDLVGGRNVGVWVYCFGVLGHSLGVDGDRSGIGRKPSLPGPGSQLIPGGFSGRNLQGQRPQEARAVGELGPLQSRFSRQVPSLAQVIL